MIEDSAAFRTVNLHFPHMGKKITLFWGYPEFASLIHDLQNDAGGGPDVGFPSDVLLAVYELSNTHDTLYPRLARKDTSVASNA